MKPLSISLNDFFLYTLPYTQTGRFNEIEGLLLSILMTFFIASIGLALYDFSIRVRRGTVLFIPARSVKKVNIARTTYLYNTISTGLTTIPMKRL